MQGSTRAKYSNVLFWLPAFVFYVIIVASQYVYQQTNVNRT
jgi:hypothetical protein